MRSRFLKFVKDENLINENDKIIVALSGGADSVVLFHLLLEIRDEMNLKVYAAHLNHMLRGTDAFSDMNFVKDLCELNKVQLFTEIVDVGRVAKEKSISEELAGRQCRYQFFDKLMKENDAKIATAHNSSDNVETVLFNLARGTSIRGVSGIPLRRENIIRPLMIFSGAEIRRYAAENNIRYCIDRTNYDDKYTRNKIRNNVIPVLREINPDIENTIKRFSIISKETSEYIENIANEKLKDAKCEYGYDSKKLSLLDDVILKAAVVEMFKSFDIHLQYKHILLLCDIIRCGGALDISDEIYCISSQNIFRIVEKNKKDKDFLLLSECKFLRRFEKDQIDFNDKDLIDVKCIDDNTVLRHRKSNDIFRPVRRNINKSLRKLMNEMKIPKEIRDDLLVVANGDMILWVEGIGSSEYGKISADTSAAVKITGEK